MERIQRIICSQINKFSLKRSADICNNCTDSDILDRNKHPMVSFSKMNFDQFNIQHIDG